MAKRDLLQEGARDFPRREGGGGGGGEDDNGDEDVVEEVLEGGGGGECFLALPSQKRARTANMEVVFPWPWKYHLHVSL